MGNKVQILSGSPVAVTLGDVMRKFFRDQLSCWPFARKNVRALKNLATRRIDLGKLEIMVQYNPSRAISSKAALDEKSIRERPCFLCRANRPAEQNHLKFEGAKGKKYDIFITPYPVLPGHFVVASEQHLPQSIWHRYVDMLRLCKRAGEFTFLYNGPKSGASAPDHFHFQAVESNILPLEKQARSDKGLRLLTRIRDAELYSMDGFVHGIFVIKSDSSKSASKLFYRLLDCTPVTDGEHEPRMNIISCREGMRYLSIVIMRSCHRPSCYFSEDPRTMFAISPGCVDMGGVLITVNKEDYDRLSPDILNGLFGEVSISAAAEEEIIRRLTRTQAELQIEIVRSETIDFEILSYGVGRRTVCLKEGKLEYGGILYDEIMFDGKVSSTMFAEPSFVIHDMPAGGTLESRQFTGGLKLIARDGRILAVNVIGIEDYLLGSLPETCKYSSLEEAEVLAIRRRSEILRSLSTQGGMVDGFVHNGHPAKADNLLKKAIDRTWGMVENV